jgi:hypothetical protein
MTSRDLKVIEEEVQYKLTNDSEGNPLEGGRMYKMHLPANIPAREFWSVIVYDSMTRLVVQTDQLWPSVYSSCKNLVVNPDGSVDVWFGPGATADKRNNWIQTLPGKGWFMILRLYNPSESWFDKTWQPGGIEPLK